MMLTPPTIINIIGAILITTITGSILMLISLLIGTILERWGFIHIRFELLKVVAFFYLCPVAYIIVKLFEMEIGRGFLFNPTPTICTVCTNLFNGWCIGVILLLCYMFTDIYKLHLRYRDAFPCDKKTQDILEKCKEASGLQGRRILLCQSYHAKIPCVTGIVHTRIILPVEQYTEETLQIILTHELTHYKQRDIWLKQLTYFVLVFHFFNPLAWLFFFQVQKQSEYVCDYRACQKTGDMKRYFKVILLTATDNNMFSVLSSQLFERKHELVGRVKKMSEVSKIKEKSKWAVVTVLVIAVFTSNLSVCAATWEGVQLYRAWYDETQSVTYDEPQELPEYEETVGYGTPDGVEVVMGEIEQVTKDLGNANWTVNHNMKMCTGYYACTAGENIDVMIRIEPSNVNVTVGIESMSGETVSIIGSDLVVHSFIVPSDGSWKFFIMNQSGQTVTTEGSYIY